MEVSSLCLHGTFICQVLSSRFWNISSLDGIYQFSIANPSKTAAFKNSNLFIFCTCCCKKNWCWVIIWLIWNDIYKFVIRVLTYVVQLYWKHFDDFSLYLCSNGNLFINLLVNKLTNIMVIHKVNHSIKSQYLLKQNCIMMLVNLTPFFNIFTILFEIFIVTRHKILIAAM